ncbi:MAG: type II secretion system F family protein [Patescibacteria group bacterium]
MNKALASFLLSFALGSEKEYFVDNLSVLLYSGMDILASLEAVAAETKSVRLRTLIRRMIDDVKNGEPIWRAMERTRLFPEQSISLIRIGEETGRLSENLRLLALQKQKDRMLRTKIIGAVAYPLFIVVLSMAVGMWVLFYLLPQLAGTFSSLNIPLPWVTRALIAVGTFTREYWMLLFPAIIAGGACAFLVAFVIPKTRFIGQYFLLHIPGVGKLLKDAETGRIGYLLGTLLGAGIDLVDAMRSVSHATNFRVYGKFFGFIADRLEEGSTFEQAFVLYKKSRKVLSVSMQQLIVASEHSGSVPNAFLSIGELYQFKADVSAKNLTVMLEPALLLFVGAGVLFLALSVILPIYSLIGGIK